MKSECISLIFTSAAVCSVDSLACTLGKLVLMLLPHFSICVCLGNAGFQLEVDMAEDQDILPGITEGQSK